MSTIIEILTAAALILSIIIPGGAFLLGERNKKRYKKSLAVNCFFFFGTLLVGTIAMFAGAQNVQAATDAAGSGLATGLGYLGAALVTGLSGIGSGIAVASSASAALGAISEEGSLFGKSPLVQYVGIPEEHMALEPSLVRLDPIPGMRYLLCSDGLTDMLSDGEIADILTREITVRETVELLLDRALKKGGRDNTTVVLCEVRETERNWLRRWIDKIRKRYEGEKDEEPNAGSGF